MPETSNPGRSLTDVVFADLAIPDDTPDTLIWRVSDIRRNPDLIAAVRSGNRM